jgi:hypothetical protein
MSIFNDIKMTKIYNDNQIYIYIYSTKMISKQKIVDGFFLYKKTN